MAMTKPTYQIAHGSAAVQAARIIAGVAGEREVPPTNLHKTDAPAAHRFYANRFATGETKRWDLAAHLMEQAADIIEAALSPTTSP